MLSSAVLEQVEEQRVGGGAAVAAAAGRSGRDGGVAGMLMGRAEAPRGELGLGSASGYAAALAGVGRLAGHQ